MDTLCSRMLLLLCLTPVLALATPSPTTHWFTLANGLKVLVHEDHRAPLVTSQLWFKVGSSDEPPGQTGLSHALEHMLYKGSSKLCSGEASALLQTLGADHNAFTGNDVTAYHQTLSPRYLGVTFELMADLMSSAHLRPEDLTPELNVIRAERRLRTDDDPMGAALERHASLAYPASGYRTPTVGWMHDLDRLDARNLRHWYQTRYAPGNATLVVVGDVTLEQVKPLAERYFAGLAERTFAPALKPLELAAPGERQQTLYQPIHSPRLIMSFNVPGLGTAEDRRTVHALRLIDMLLAGSTSARISKRLHLQEQVFSEVSSEYDELTRGDSLLMLVAQLATPTATTLDEAQTRIWQLLEELRSAAPPLQELERARTQLIARQVYAQDSLEQQASRLANLEIIGLPDYSTELELAELKQVTPEDIRQTAATYLTRNRLSVTQVLVEKSHE